MNNITFTSSRTEAFAVSCVRDLFAHFGYQGLVEEENLKKIVQISNFQTIVKKLHFYSQRQHVGAFGIFEAHIQKELNLKLTIYDLLGQTKQKNKLIQQVREKHDNYKVAKGEKEADLKFLQNLEKSIDRFNDFKPLLKKIRRLYVIQKSQLRRYVANEEEFQEAINCLETIYSKHIQRAIDLNKEDK